MSMRPLIAGLLLASVALSPRAYADASSEDRAAADALFEEAGKLAGGAPTTFASGSGAPVTVAVDANNVYWTTGGVSGAVMRAPIGGGAAATVANNQNLAQGIALNATSICWVTFGDGVVTCLAK
jgi:hypothetical protein